MMLVHHVVMELNTMTLPLDAPPGVQPGLDKVLGWFGDKGRTWQGWS